MIPEIKQSTRNFLLKEKGVRVINRLNFAFIDFETDVLIPGNENSYEIIQYQTNYKGNNFIITGKYLTQNGFELRPIVENTIASFNILESINNTTLEKQSIGTENDLSIYIRIFFLLLIILGISLVYRKHNQNKKINFEFSSSEKGDGKNSNKYDDTTSKTSADNLNNDFTAKKTEYYDIEKYVEVDETDLTEIEKAKVYGKVLGLNGKVSKSDITKAWKKILEKYHPDKVSHLGKEFQIFAEKKTKDINKAYTYFKKKYNI